jgi:pilus assembly protein Flp/PilA
MYGVAGPRAGPTGVCNISHFFFKDETAATVIEYGLIAAGIAVAIIAVVQGLGTKLTSTFSTVSTALK